MQIGDVTVSTPALVALGAAVGFVGGVFGVGGGFLLTPLLAVVFHVPLHIAVGTGLCQIVATSLVSMLKFRRAGLGELRVDLGLLGGSVLGVEGGARALSALGTRTVSIGGVVAPLAPLVLQTAYVLMLGFVWLSFARPSRSGVEPLDYLRFGPLSRARLPLSVRLPAVQLPRVSMLLIAYLGLGLGFLSGLLGIGGGVVLMPVLVHGFGFPLRQAAGTGLLVLCVTAAVGTARHAMVGNVSLPLAMALLAAAPVSAMLGSRATKRLPATALRRGFSVVLLLTMAAVAWDLWRKVR
ncbi:MAG: sulfite exporter TauE/SafE family protein [Polyangiaceae bacterium]|nr:sulfite exporter TauE/SafE family protein [Polyangiaceae bacterium]